ncbi:MAG TPA: type I-E CRISPR-associated endoribonuclease Cas2e [Spirochaetales bacterium]|nr:type I-E CRISPR-associated endoribonuclease Cas2e [Spirochaetales bacterium]
MVVVIANELPPAVRGRMKLWFVEPRANVFVSGIKDAVADEVVQYLYKSCPPSSGLIIFQRIPHTPGFKILGKGDPEKKISVLDGYPLVIEKQIV